MATALQDTLARISGKADVLLEKYYALLDEKADLEAENAQLRADNDQLRRDVDKLQSDNDYLKMARTIVPDTAGLADGKAIISKLVRDIDKCISQLNG